jgi:hypothetical protein
MNLTYDEQQLIAIFNAGTRKGTITALEKMSTELDSDETELRNMTASALEKLRIMSDADYETLDLMPDMFE